VQTLLQRRPNGRYYYRRRIPNDLIEHYGRGVISKALGTAERREAESLARAMSVKHDEEFAARRAALLTAPHSPEEAMHLAFTMSPLLWPAHYSIMTFQRSRKCTCRSSADMIAVGL
jgi:hypothetical protein